jgi:hypothetical protein
VQVGLHRQYYDISSWPQELQQAVVNPAVAAAAKGKGLQPPATAAVAAAAAVGTQQQLSQQQQQQQQEVGCRNDQLQESGGGAMQQLMRVSAVPNTGPELEALRQRLWAMLQTEADACDM